MTDLACKPEIMWLQERGWNAAGRRSLAAKNILVQKLGKNDGATGEEAVDEEPDSLGARDAQAAVSAPAASLPRCSSRYRIQWHDRRRGLPGGHHRHTCPTAGRAHLAAGLTRSSFEETYVTFAIAPGRQQRTGPDPRCSADRLWSP
jgi:hypothetical protein